MNRRGVIIRGVNIRGVNSQGVNKISELITGLNSEALEDRRRQLLFDEGLEPQLPENGVYSLLLLAREEGYLED